MGDPTNNSYEMMRSMSEGQSQGQDQGQGQGQDQGQGQGQDQARVRPGELGVRWGACFAADIPQKPVGRDVVGQGGVRISPQTSSPTPPTAEILNLRARRSGDRAFQISIRGGVGYGFRRRHPPPTPPPIEISKASGVEAIHLRLKFQSGGGVGYGFRRRHPSKIEKSSIFAAVG